MNHRRSLHHDEFLRGIRTFADMCDYFVDELEWPLDLSRLDDESLDDITFDWDPNELGIEHERLKSFTSTQANAPIDCRTAVGCFLRRVRRSAVAQNAGPPIAPGACTPQTGSESWSPHMATR